MVAVQPAALTSLLLLFLLQPLASLGALTDAQFLRTTYFSGVDVPAIVFKPSLPNVQMVVELYLRTELADLVDLYIASGVDSLAVQSLSPSDESSLSAAAYRVLEPVVRASSECATSDGACAYYAHYLSPCNVGEHWFAVVAKRHNESAEQLLVSLRYATTAAQITVDMAQPVFNESLAAFAHPQSRWRQRIWRPAPFAMTLSVGYEGEWAPRTLLLLARVGACPTLRAFDWKLELQTEGTYPLCPPPPPPPYPPLAPLCLCKPAFVAPSQSATRRVSLSVGPTDGPLPGAGDERRSLFLAVHLAPDVPSSSSRVFMESAFLGPSLSDGEPQLGGLSPGLDLRYALEVRLPDWLSLGLDPGETEQLPPLQPAQLRITLERLDALLPDDPGVQLQLVCKLGCLGDSARRRRRLSGEAADGTWSSAGATTEDAGVHSLVVPACSLTDSVWELLVWANASAAVAPAARSRVLQFRLTAAWQSLLLAIPAGSTSGATPPDVAPLAAAGEDSSVFAFFPSQAESGTHTLLLSLDEGELTVSVRVLPPLGGFATGADPVDLVLSRAALCSADGEQSVVATALLPALAAADGSADGSLVYGLSVRQPDLSLRGLWHVSLVPAGGAGLGAGAGAVRYTIKASTAALRAEPLPDGGALAGRVFETRGNFLLPGQTHSFVLPASARSIVHATGVLLAGPPLEVQLALVSDDSALERIVLASLSAPVPNVTLAEGSEAWPALAASELASGEQPLRLAKLQGANTSSTRVYALSSHAFPPATADPILATNLSLPLQPPLAGDLAFLALNVSAGWRLLVTVRHLDELDGLSASEAAQPCLYALLLSTQSAELAAPLSYATPWASETQLALTRTGRVQLLLPAAPEGSFLEVEVRVRVEGPSAADLSFALLSARAPESLLPAQTPQSAAACDATGCWLVARVSPCDVAGASQKALVLRRAAGALVAETALLLTLRLTVRDALLPVTELALPSSVAVSVFEGLLPLLGGVSTHRVLRIGSTLAGYPELRLRTETGLLALGLNATATDDDPLSLNATAQSPPGAIVRVAMGVCADALRYAAELSPVVTPVLCSRKSYMRGVLQAEQPEAEDWRCLEGAAESERARARPLGSAIDLDVSHAGYSLPLRAQERLFASASDARQSSSRSVSNVTASRFAYDVDASVRELTMCARAGEYLFVALEADAELGVGVESAVKLSVEEGEMPNQFERFQLNNEDQLEYRLPTANTAGVRALSQLVASVAYGASRHFRFELRDPAARLRFFSAVSSSRALQPTLATTRVALLLSRGRCPDIGSYAAASWAEMATQDQASLLGVVRATESADAAALTLLRRPVQVLSLPYERSVAGSYYLTVLGVSPDAHELQLFGTVQCGLGFEVRSFTNSCSPCPVGLFRNDPEATRCELCAQGTYAPVPGSVNCTQCAPGTYLPPTLEGQIAPLSCLLCAEGTAQPNFKSTECLPCTDGTYNSELGLTECFNCPNNTNSFVGAVAPEDCQCKATFYSPTGRVGNDCLECPVGATCEGGRSAPYAQSGFWQLAGERYQRVFPECIYSDACSAGNTCVEGYSGLLCARCAPGFYTRSSLCYTCPDLFGVGAENSGETILLLTAAGLVALAMVLYTLSDPEQLERTSTIFITINFLQLINYFPLFRLSWPQFALDLFASLAIFNLNIELLAIECYFPSINFVQRVLISFSLPFLMLAVMGCLLVLLTLNDLLMLCLHSLGCFGRREAVVVVTAQHLGSMPPQPERAALRPWERVCGSALQRRLNRFISAQLMFVSLCYIFLAYNAGSLLQCREVVAAKGFAPAVAVLERFPDLVCGSPDYVRLQWLGVAGLTLYVIGFPLSLYLVIWRGRSVGALTNPTFLARFGFFFARFEERYWYWEFVLMLRKLVVVYGAMFLNQYTLIQTGLGLITLFLSVMGQDYARPYRNEIGDNLDFVLTMCAHFLLFDGLLFYAGEVRAALSADVRVNTQVAAVTNRNYLIMRELAINVLFLFGVSSALTSAWYELRRFVRDRMVAQTHAKSLQSEEVVEVVHMAELMLLPALVPKLLEFMERSSLQERKALLQVLKMLQQHYLDNQEESQSFLSSIAEFATKFVRNLAFFLSLLLTLVKVLTCQPTERLTKQQKQAAEQSKDVAADSWRPAILQRSRERRYRRRLQRKQESQPQLPHSDSADDDPGLTKRGSSRSPSPTPAEARGLALAGLALARPSPERGGRVSASAPASGLIRRSVAIDQQGARPPPPPGAALGFGAPRSAGLADVEVQVVRDRGPGLGPRPPPGDGRGPLRFGAATAQRRASPS